MSFNTYLYIGFALYGMFVLYVGFIGAIRIKKLSDFAVAGEALGPIPLGLAFTATFFSAATFLGYVGFAYAWGQTALWIFLAIFGGSTLGLILIAKGVRESNKDIKALSLPDWLGEMYQSDAVRAIVALIIMIQVFYGGGQFSAGGTLLNGLLGFDYQAAVWIIMALLLLM